jgi:excisionase family DNA binding protein
MKARLTPAERRHRCGQAPDGTDRLRLRDIFPGTVLMYGAHERYLLEQASHWPRLATRRSESYERYSGNRSQSSQFGATIDWQELLPPERRGGAAPCRATTGNQSRSHVPPHSSWRPSGAPTRRARLRPHRSASRVGRLVKRRRHQRGTTSAHPPGSDDSRRSALMSDKVDRHGERGCPRQLSLQVHIATEGNTLSDNDDRVLDLLGDSSVLDVTPGRAGQLLTIAEAAAALRISRSSVYRLFDAGELCWVRICGSRRVSAAEINRFITAHTEVA